MFRWCNLRFFVLFECWRDENNEKYVLDWRRTYRDEKKERWRTLYKYQIASIHRSDWNTISKRCHFSKLRTKYHLFNLIIASSSPLSEIKSLEGVQHFTFPLLSSALFSPFYAFLSIFLVLFLYFLNLLNYAHFMPIFYVFLSFLF